MTTDWQFDIKQVVKILPLDYLNGTIVERKEDYAFSRWYLVVWFSDENRNEAWLREIELSE